MKKILLLCCVLISSISFAQVLLEDFEGTPNLDAGFGGLASSTVVDDPEPMGTRGKVARLAVAQAAGQPWQGANLFLDPDVVLTADKSMTIDLYSTSPVQILAKVDLGSGPPSAVEVVHTGTGWETISFTFNLGRDGTGTANGVYPLIAFFPNWNTALAGPGGAFNPVPQETVVHIDNVYQGTFIPGGGPVEDVTGDVYINDGTFTAGDFTTAAGQDIATNDGSAAEPFATLDYALARSIQAPGDVIYIDAGTYSWPTTHALTDSGTLANPITIQGKGNNETNITTTAASTTSAGLHFTTGEHWVVKDLNWTATAARSVWVDAVDGITLDNCIINMTYNSTPVLQSIIIGTAGGELTIKNSTITRSNTSFHIIEVVEGTTLIMQDNTVSFNALALSGTASSVQLRTNASSLFIIERNRFVNGGYGIGIIVGTAGPVNANSIVKNNFFNSFFGIVSTIVQDLTVHNNSFYTAGECIYGINAGSLTGWDIRNNILYTYSTSRSCILSGSATSHPAIMDYNHYYSPNSGAGRTTLGGSVVSFANWQNAPGGPWETNGQGGNTPAFDPLYVDAANGDLHLQSGSPAIAAGVDVGITDDIDGDIRSLSGTFDMGADEFDGVSCTTVIGVTSVTCDSFGIGATDDTYSVTVDFSNSLNGTIYVVTANSGTVGGDDPTVDAAGTITVTGITEGTDLILTVDNTADGGFCSLSTTITSPSCSPVICSDFLIEDFDGPTAPTLNFQNGDGSAAIIPDPTGAGYESVLEIITANAQAPWQQAELLTLQQDVDLTTADKTLSVEWYSLTPFDALLGVRGGTDINSNADAAHGGTGWETLVFDFTIPEDVPPGTLAPNGTYTQLFFFPLWDIDSPRPGVPGGDGWFIGDPLGSAPTPNSSIASTTYVANVYQGTVVKTEYTFNNGWLPADPAGNSSCFDSINIVSGDVNITANTEINNLRVQPGASMTVDSGVTLTANTVNLNSSSTQFSSLILDGTIAGTINYNRHVNINGSGETGSNDLISAPLTGQVFSDFVTANPNILSNTAETLFLFGPFDKSIGDYVTYSNTESATLDAGVGYRAASDDNDTFTFTGIANNGTVTNNITNTGPTETEWNLVGNPYPSYLNVQDFLNHEVATGVTNINLLNSGTAAIYGYDGSAQDGWTIYNLANTDATTVLAPGQGFFVSADPTNAPLYDLEFTPAMRTTGASDDFIVGRNTNTTNSVLSKLSLSSSTKTSFTSIYFIEGTTRGLDNGYDAARFQGQSDEFAIFTNLVENNEGLDMAIQTLPYNDFSDVVVPLGVKAAANVEMTVSIDAASSLPVGVNVYLEDTLKNTLTLLNNSTYVFTPESDLTGAGRFFLRYTTDTLNELNIGLDNVLIYVNNQLNDVVIKGQLNSTDNAVLFDIQGRRVIEANLNTSNNINTINVNGMSPGVYIIQLTDDNSVTKTQKLIIR